MSSDARAVANDPRAPADERADANAELARVYAPLKSALIPSDAMQDVIRTIRDGLAADDELLKGHRILTTDMPGRRSQPDKRGMQSVYLDELNIFAMGDWYERPSPLGYDGLRQMVEQTPILNAIVLTRLRQISRFLQPSEDGGAGFEIRHVDRTHKLTPDEKESTKLLSSFIANCGWEWNPTKRKRMKRDNFKSFMLKHYRDSLTMDSAPIERECKRDRDLGLDGFYSVDGATIRLCTEDGYQGDDEIFAVQVVNGMMSTAYTYDQLIYEVRNPRTDVRLAGYGMSEVELLIRIVTGFLNAMTMNIKGFDSNSIPKGLLQITGDYGAEDQAYFKRQWNNTVKGINNQWVLPVLFSKDAEGKATFEKFNVEFNEMMFAKWMTFLTSIACAVYGMSPDEINFESFAASKSSLSGSDTAEKLANAKDSGLYPDMAHFEAEITDYILKDFSDKFVFRWVGLKPEDEDKAFEAKKLILTVDELRAEQGYEKCKDDLMGGAPLNPSLMALYQQQNTQPEGQDFGGQPGQGPDYGQVPEDGADGDGQDGQPQDGGEDAPGQPPAPGDSQGASSPGGQQGGEFGGAGQGDFGKALTIWAIGDQE